MTAPRKEGAGARVLHPAGWAAAKGYANGIAAEGRLVFVGGQIGWNAAQEFESADFVAQARQALAEHRRRAGGGRRASRARHAMTWYVVDKREYLACGKALGAAYREIMGRHYPAMTAVEVTALMENAARVEIEATAVVPAAD